jgi:FAD/FMN-containing dehydrogenase
LRRSGRRNSRRSGSRISAEEDDLDPSLGRQPDVESATPARHTAAMSQTIAQLAPHHVDQLRRSCPEVITPDDPAYDDARRLWNAIHDRRPAVIARPTTAQQVAAAVLFGQDHDLEIQIRSGGHAAAAFGGVDGGLLVDMSAMRGVRVDPDARTAWANGGALLGELDVAALEHGLVCPIGVIGHTGVAGLTLGGGIGRLQRNYGLTIDNLTAVELVTADGRLVRATADEEPELFWGLRGAGWNFGIATAFEFRLQPFGPDLHRGVLTYRADRLQEIWGTFNDFARRAPDPLALIFGIARAAPDEGYPDDVVGGPVVYVAWNHSGTAAGAERDTAELRATPSPLTTMLASQPYLDVQTAHDLAFAWGSRSFIKSHNADDVRPQALEEIVELVATAPGDSSFSVTTLGGAIARVPEDATAFAGRTATFDLSADSDWSDAADDAATIAWCRRVIEVVEPDRTLGAYSNGNAESGPDATRRIYGDAKLARLAGLKRTWDPANVFHVNPNVPPAPESRPLPGS